MERNVCIMLGGKAGSGKDEIANYIVNKHVGFYQYALADPVRKIARVAFAVPLKYKNYFHERELKEQKIPGYNYSSREMCQIIGNEFRNLFYNDIWCDNLFTRSKIDSNIIISDYRYPNEREYYINKFEKCLCVQVIRDGYDGSVGINNHPSETQKLQYDYIIHNNGTLIDLYQKVEAMMLQCL